MTPANLHARIRAGTAPAILDVRSRMEFVSGHVPGAVHVPFWTLPARIADVPGTKSDPIVVYCGHGPRAWMAGTILKLRGFTGITYLDGHMRGWYRAELPVEGG